MPVGGSDSADAEYTGKNAADAEAVATFAMKDLRPSMTAASKSCISFLAITFWGGAENALHLSLPRTMRVEKRPVRVLVKILMMGK